MLELAQRISQVEESKTVGLAAIVDQLRSEGKKIISLNIGEPDFSPPAPIIEATKKALDEGHTNYSLVPGLRELRSLITQKLKVENGITCAPENILLANGSKQVLYNIFQTLCSVGDEIIIPRPYWGTFPDAVKLAGGVPVFIDTDENYQLDLNLIEKAISSKTKAILINTPNNPTGAVYPRATLEKLADIALKHKIYIISDEAYEMMVFDSNKHISIASLSPEVFKQTITVQSFSKGHGMTGYRLGYMAATTDIIRAVNKLQSHLCGNVCTFAQYGAIAALSMDKKITDDLMKGFQRKKELAVKLARPLFDFPEPQGAFYLFPNIKRYSDRFQTSAQMAEYILKNAHVAIVPGTTFGQEGYLRISFATSEELIEKAFAQMAAVL